MQRKLWEMYKTGGELTYPDSLHFLLHPEWLTVSTRLQSLTLALQLSQGVQEARQTPVKVPPPGHTLLHQLLLLLHCRIQGIKPLAEGGGVTWMGSCKSETNILWPPSPSPSPSH